MTSDIRLDNLIWVALTVLFIIVTSTGLGLLARAIARWRGLSEGEQRKLFWGITLAGPWIVGFLIFVVGPALASLFYSFNNYKLGESLEWTGLENYRALIMGIGAHGRRFTQAMYNSFYYALIGVPLQIITALGMALLLNNEIRGIRSFRTIFYLPVILAGGPAILLAWRYMLSANGGFVNVILQKLASSFFLFDWLYRGFIFVMEGFNSFYTGLSRGDPLGPLKFVIPGALAILILITLLGDWSESKRARTWGIIQILALIVLAATLPRGLMAAPIDPIWTVVVGLAFLGFILLSAWQGHEGRVRAFQIAALIVFAITLALTLAAAAPDSGDPAPYLIAAAAAAAPVLLSLFGVWSRRKYTLLGIAFAILALAVFIHVIPGQLDGGRLALIPRYLTFGTTLEQPGDLTYLKETYPAEIMSAIWFFALAVVMLAAIALLGDRYPRARRAVLYISLAFFLLFTAGALVDGVRYFRAFDTIAAETGTPAYHFARFRTATAQFPTQDRVPLWMTSELWTKPSLVLITMWSTGAGMLIFLAALKGVPRSLYEAAEVDGAGRTQKFFKITLPMISPAMFYNIVIGMIAALQTFESIYILRTPDTEDTLASAAFFLFVRTFRQLDIGQGAAASWILVVVIVVLTVIQFRYSNWVNYEA